MSKPLEEESKVKDYFGTFLESVKRTSPEYEEENLATSSAQPPPQQGVSSIAVLTLLSTEPDPVPLPSLQGRLGLGALDVGPILAPLVDSGLIGVAGDPGNEVVALTDAGRKLARAAS